MDKEEYFVYLDDLRVCDDAPNMFGAAPYLQAEFDLDRKEARKILAEWMETFDERHSK